MKIRFTGPPAQKCPLLTAHGYSARCESGAEYELPAETARLLAGSSAMWQLDEPAGGDLAKLTRPQLNELAVEAGVQEPEKLPNKDAVLAALAAAAAGGTHEQEQEG